MKKCMLIVLTFLATTGVFGQSSDDDWKDRLIFGGNAGPAIFPGGFIIQVSPLAGYRITDRFISGLQAPYTYAQFRLSSGELLKQNSYGLSPFARYFPLDNFFLHGELESVGIKTTQPSAYSTGTRLWFSSPMIGLGYGSPVGGYIMALYIPNYNPARSLYFSPLVIRGGFAF